MSLCRAAYALATASWLIAATLPAAQAAPSKATTASEGAKTAPKAKPKAAAKPKAKPVTKAKPAAKSAPPLARKPGSKPGTPNEAARRTVAGEAGPAIPPADQQPESEELAAMRQVDAALFPVASSPANAPWLMGDLDLDAAPSKDGAPALLSSGMPPRTSLEGTDATVAQPSGDLTWLKSLAMPDLPVRWDARVVRYLQYYRDDARGRSMVATWIRKSGRYSEAIRKVLREQGVPEDILWLALVESGFNPAIYSPVGAAGLWQFMPHGARIYGLTVDRWVDERLDPERSTIAAARYLADLKQRFGAWELALAAYNMGYGGLLAAIRKYNTNDFWELSRFEAGVPYETALYVPKIIAMAIVARNCDVFHCADITPDAPVPFDKVSVAPGVTLRAVADASGASEGEIGKLNPQFLADRVPPALPDTARSAWMVRVPPGRGERAAKAIPAAAAAADPKLDRYRVRWGETLETIAASYQVTTTAIQQANDLRRGEILRPGTVIYLPQGAASSSTPLPAERPVIVVPSVPGPIEGLRRVFYQPTTGDTLREVAAAFRVSQDKLAAWNMLDPRAKLHSGMNLQVYIPPQQRLDEVRVVDEAQATLLTAGSEAFFAHFEALKGRRRVEIAAQEGDTFRGVAQKYGLTAGMLERINQRSRYAALEAGDKLVVYVAESRLPTPAPSPSPAVQADEAVAAAADKDDDADEAEAEAEAEVKPAVLQTTPVVTPPGGAADEAPSKP